MGNTKIGLGVIGIGLRGQHSYEQILGNDPRVEVRAVCSYPGVEPALQEGHDTEYYRDYAASLGAEYLGEDYQLLLERDDIQFVSLMCQPDRALELGKACVAAGKAFLRDKPPTKTAEDAWKLSTLVEDSGVFAGLAMPLRYNPSLKYVADSIHDGKHDEIIAVTMSYVWAGGPLAGFTASQGYLNAYGGGDMTTAGFHAIDYLNWLIKADPVEVVCQMDSFFYDDYKALKMDDLGQMIICYDNGVVATLLAGRVPSREANHSWLDVPSKSGSLEIRSYSASVRVAGPLGMYSHSISTDSLKMLAKDYLDAFEQGKNPPVAIADGAKVLSVLEAARKSSISGHAQKVFVPSRVETLK